MCNNNCYQLCLLCSLGINELESNASKMEKGKFQKGNKVWTVNISNNLNQILLQKRAVSDKKLKNNCNINLLLIILIIFPTVFNIQKSTRDYFFPGTVHRLWSPWLCFFVGFCWILLFIFVENCWILLWLFVGICRNLWVFVGNCVNLCYFVLFFFIWLQNKLETGEIVICVNNLVAWF